jgi:hypothetical protein
MQRILAELWRLLCIRLRDGLVPLHEHACDGCFHHEILVIFFVFVCFVNQLKLLTKLYFDFFDLRLNWGKALKLNSFDRGFSFRCYFNLEQRASKFVLTPEVSRCCAFLYLDILGEFFGVR